MTVYTKFFTPSGKELDAPRLGQWLRPVSSRPTREVSEEERRYETGDKAQLLDIVTVPLNGHSPIGHQSENHILAEDYYWTKEGTATWEQISTLVDMYDPTFWVDRMESTYHGHNDKISEQVVANIASSLKLVIPTNLRLAVVSESGFQGQPPRTRLRAHFDYHQRPYNLVVTDPEIEERYLRQGQGFYPINSSMLCVSLAELHHGYASLLVASVITPDRCENQT